MKNSVKLFFYILGLIIGIVLILMAIWFYIKIYNEFSSKDGVLYDGFGYEYVYEKPHNPYTICIYIFLIIGLNIAGFFRKKLIEQRDNKSDINR